ncbi:MAG: outer membrane lipoprotein chaperone LolA [Pseudomonadales bacterium]|nr:outer membrane lipoprotein chaperone LolA [Pseudomonadales bacterium]
MIFSQRTTIFKRLYLSLTSLLVLLSSLMLTSTVNAAEHGEEAATKQLILFLSKMNAMEAKFRQWVEDSKKTTLQDVNGTIWVQRPGKFRWDTNLPYPQSIISDGDLLWIYDVDLEQVTQRKLDKHVGNTPALLLSGDPSKISSSFKVSAYEYEETGEWRFDLLPKAEDALFELLRVHFLKGALRDMYLRDSLGQTTRIEFSDAQINKTIEAKIFNFVPPEGVDVIKEF